MKKRKFNHSNELQEEKKNKIEIRRETPQEQKCPKKSKPLKRRDTNMQ